MYAVNLNLSDTLIQNAQTKGLTLQTYFDDNAVNPRKIEGNLGTLVGGGTVYCDVCYPNDIAVSPDINEAMTNFCRYHGLDMSRVVWMPIHFFRRAESSKSLGRLLGYHTKADYLIDDIAYRCIKPQDWRIEDDLFGFIYATYEQVFAEYNVKAMSDGVLAQTYEQLSREIKDFEKWSNGYVYGIQVSDKFGSLESQWGVYDYEMETIATDLVEQCNARKKNPCNA